MKFDVYVFEQLRAPETGRFAAYCKPGFIEGPLAGTMKPMAAYGATREEAVKELTQNLKSLVEVCALGNSSTRFIGCDEVNIAVSPCVLTDNLGKLLPSPVVAAIDKYNHQHMSTIPVVYNELRWDSIQKCYFFERNGMLHGVELDGYIHT